MKIIKPMRLGLLHKVFEQRRQPYFVVSLLLCFPFEPPRRLLYEASLWKLAGSELGQDALLDEAMFKPRGELLVTGRCFTPARQPRTASSVRVALGTIDKTLYVVGDRRFGLLGMSDPEPFTEMPIHWRNAFGGEGYAPNPLGKGIAPVRSGEGAVHPLPNVEHPDHLMKSTRDRPPPAGLDACDMTWPERAAKRGTYDDAWVRNDFPGLARDLDFGFFNMAPPDQQIEGYFRGDEPFVIENMHPDKPRLAGALPGLATRCFITRKTDEGEELREIVMRLDTVRLFPHRERGILVFRGVTRIREDDAGDVLHLLAACEAMGAPKPVEHYKAVLAERLDKQRRHLFALRDSDLMPPAEGPESPPLPDDTLSGLAALMRREGHLHRNQARREERHRADARAHIERVKEQLRAQGLNPEVAFPAQAPEAAPGATEPPTLDELPEYLERVQREVEQAREKAKAERAEAEERARAACAKYGVDHDAILEKARREAGGPPKFSAKKELDRLRDLAEMARNGEVAWPELEGKLADPQLEDHLVKSEEQLRATYRKFAHHFPAASRLDGDEARRLRDEVIAGHAAGQSFSGRDLTGADLSHLDLRGIDLRGAMLEAAALTGADLTGALLTGAVLARADLEGADLTGAKLAGANLGAAKLREARLRGGLELSDVVLAKADLDGADLTGARLTRCDLSEATFGDAELRGVTGERLLFIQVDLSGAALAGADLRRCIFLEARLAGADLHGANLSASTFVTAQGDGVVLRGGKLDKLRLVKGSSFAGADFQGASMKQANLMGARLAGSDFTGADLRSAVLNESDLSGATLDRAVLVEAMLVRANLSGASLYAADLRQSILQKANLRGATLEKANLFSADVGRSVGDEETSLAGANVKRVSFVAARRADDEG